MGADQISSVGNANLVSTEPPADGTLPKTQSNVILLTFDEPISLPTGPALSIFGGGFEDGYVHGALGGLVGSLVAMMLVDWFLPYVYNVSFRGFRTSALAWMFLGGLVALEHVVERTTN